MIKNKYEDDFIIDEFKTKESYYHRFDNGIADELKYISKYNKISMSKVIENIIEFLYKKYDLEMIIQGRILIDKILYNDYNININEIEDINRNGKTLIHHFLDYESICKLKELSFFYKCDRVNLLHNAISLLYKIIKVSEIIQKDINIIRILDKRYKICINLK
jgi:hypothetical protein